MDPCSSVSCNVRTSCTWCLQGRRFSSEAVLVSTGCTAVMCEAFVQNYSLKAVAAWQPRLNCSLTADGTPVSQTADLPDSSIQFGCDRLGAVHSINIEPSLLQATAE